MAVINSPFESQYGFKAPGFSVDELGNIIATSITTSTEDNAGIVDFTVTEAAEQFEFANIEGNTPSITLARSSSYRFSLDVPILRFKIYQSDQETLYSNGLTHSDGTTGVNAQGKTSGILAFSVSATAPSVLYYGDDNGNVFGTISIIDPQGSFSTVDINSTTASTSPLTGALTVAGGVGIEGDLFIGQTLNVSDINATSINSLTDIDFDAANTIIVKIAGNTLGTINTIGSTVPVVNTNINNTVIGATTPTTAAFTSATVLALPTVDSSVTNRQYVDSTALSLAIAFGL